MRAVPVRPWVRFGVDLFQYVGRAYLVVFDVYSNFPEVEQITDTTTYAMVKVLSALFAIIDYRCKCVPRTDPSSVPI